MNINDMLNDNSFLINFEATSKKHLLNELCKLANKNFNIDERVLLENLTKRKNLALQLLETVLLFLIQMYGMKNH